MAQASVADAERAYREAVAAHYKAGVAVAWNHGEHRQTGTVLRYDHHSRLWVRNDKSGKNVWVETTSLI